MLLKKAEVLIIQSTARRYRVFRQSKIQIWDEGFIDEAYEL